MAPSLAQLLARLTAAENRVADLEVRVGNLEVRVAHVEGYCAKLRPWTVEVTMMLQAINWNKLKQAYGGPGGGVPSPPPDWP